MSCFSFLFFVIGEKAYMAESHTFFLSFAPAMDILQHKGI